MALLTGAGVRSASATPLESGDIVFGLNRATAAETLQHVTAGGVLTADTFDTNFATFIQGVALDNSGGLRANPVGNLIGVNFGTAANGGSLTNIAVTGLLDVNQPLFNFQGLGPQGATLARFSGPSFNDSNNRLAVWGFESHRFIVFGYDAGATPGTGQGAALTSVTESAQVFTGTAGRTAGTMWLDDNRVAAFTQVGVDSATQLQIQVFDTSDSSLTTFGSAINLPAGSGPQATWLAEYEDRLYAFQGSFVTPSTVNTLWVFDADTGSLLSTADGIDFSGGAANTFRSAAFTADGDLLFSEFGGEISIIPFADLAGLDEITLGITTVVSPQFFYSSGIGSASFNQIVIADGTALIPEPSTVAAVLPCLAATWLVLRRRRTAVAATGDGRQPDLH